MALVKPFICIRPDKGVAAEVAALPYDVYSREEAKAAVKDKPLSFLNIDRPETQYDADFDMYSAKAYETARDMLKARIADGTYVVDEDRSYYIYELTMNGRTQTGIVACCSIDDYANGVIKKHENTLAAKEEDRVNHIRTVGAQTGPIFLAYRKNEIVADIINKYKECKNDSQAQRCTQPGKMESCSTDPVNRDSNLLYDFTSDDGIRHRVWKIDSEDTEKIKDEFAKINQIYIADGHHRAASAVRVGFEKRAQMNDMPCQAEANPESDFFLSVLFADEELKILPYNRVVKDLNGHTDADFMEELGKYFSIEHKKYGQLEKGEINMCFKGSWYALKLKEEYKSEDPVDGLDVSRLQTLVLDPILGIKDPKTDSRIKFVGGIRGDKELERLVTMCGYTVAFSMYPTQMSELLAVADAGKLMPPKSTWFEPKLRSGIFIHKI